MKSHEEFKQEIKAAPQDISLPIFQDLLERGYTTARFNKSSSAVDAICLSKDGDTVELSDYLPTLQHAAPLYEFTHVGTKGTLTVSGPGLPDILVSAFGIVD